MGSHTVDSSRVELHELEVLKGQPSARDHGIAIAGARVRRRGREPRATIPAGRQHRVLCAPRVREPRFEKTELGFKDGFARKRGWSRQTLARKR